MFAFGVGLCLLAFLSSYWAARKHLVAGLAVTLFWGYTYGIARANILNAASHFIFDAALIACFTALLGQRLSLDQQRRSGALRDWLSVLMGWTLLIALLPFQAPLVTLVGLRGNLFFIPVALLASRIRDVDLRAFTVCLAALNLLALGFGVAEYFMGIERFFPFSEVTLIIYRSRDVAGGNYRIPSIFANAHAYAGTMVATIPFLLGLIGLPQAAKWQRWFGVAGMVAALFGVLFSNTRTNFVVVALLLISFLLIGKMSPSLKGAILVIIIAIGAVAMSNERFQRFRSLEESGAMTGRLAGSVNRTFLEVVFDYPLGNGLGGGGTSVPHFLAHQVRRAVAVENEYARIALELGVPGLVLWVSFILWILSRVFVVQKRDPWASTRRILAIYLLFNFASSLIGTGMLTAIPATFISMFSIGWLVTRPAEDDLLPASPLAARHTMEVDRVSGVQ
jgi:hypothetical protein